MRLLWPDEMGGIKFDGVSGVWDGGHPLNLEQAWSAAPLEFENHRHPGVDGSLPRRVMVGEGSFVLNYHLSCLCDPDGDPVANPALGAELNYEHLRDIVGTPSTWPGRTFTLRVQRPSGLWVVGEVQASVSELGVRQGSVVSCSVQVVVPAGELVLEGS